MATSTAVTAEGFCNNSATEGDDGNQDDSNSSVQMHRRKLFRIDTSKIESVPHCRQNAELQDLDLHVYDQETFEQGHLNTATFCLVGQFVCQQDYSELMNFCEIFGKVVLGTRNS